MCCCCGWITEQWWSKALLAEERREHEVQIQFLLHLCILRDGASVMRLQSWTLFMVNICTRGWHHMHREYIWTVGIVGTSKRWWSVRAVTPHVNVSLALKLFLFGHWMVISLQLKHPPIKIILVMEWSKDFLDYWPLKQKWGSRKCLKCIRKGTWWAARHHKLLYKPST